MEGREKLDHIARFREDAKVAKQQDYKAQSKARLQKNIASKIRTVMIGDLARMEEKFGYLWGQGKARSQLTDEELNMEDLKAQLRTDILNHGNNLLRAAAAEIDQYEVEWMRHQYNVAENGENNAVEIGKVYGLNKDGTRKQLRYGTNSDGSVKTSAEGNIDE